MVSYDRAMKRTKLGEVLEDDAGFVSLENHKGGVLLTLNKEPFKGGGLGADEAEEGARQWLYALTSTRQFTPAGLVDRFFDARMAHDFPDDVPVQELSLDAELRWPPTDTEKARRMATQAMHDMVRTFGYLGESLLSDTYARVSHEQGIELQVGQSGVSTKGIAYDQLQGKAELYGFKLSSNREMVTCLSGLVAIARTR